MITYGNVSLSSLVEEVVDLGLMTYANINKKVVTKYIRKIKL